MRSWGHGEPQPEQPALVVVRSGKTHPEEGQQLLTQLRVKYAIAGEERTNSSLRMEVVAYIYFLDTGNIIYFEWISGK
jgi:hypothetical protein